MNDHIRHKVPCITQLDPPKMRAPSLVKKLALATTKVYVVAACLCTRSIFYKKRRDRGTSTVSYFFRILD